ncbi:hypothetical protein ACN38_g11600 [Penicillium nordicum]|uniref:Uncharacterized protein n=1 Tax=Penicillium nordicum TaxID=229535 RepID=A0A0M9WAM6_9EURO|nr:hypothetical protein ACN38_g11600 [Penicillium nordicum]
MKRERISLFHLEESMDVVVSKTFLKKSILCPSGPSPKSQGFGTEEWQTMDSIVENFLGTSQKMMTQHMRGTRPRYHVRRFNTDESR